MNEAETRAELIDPRLKACGWGVVEGSRVLREYGITAGRIQTGGRGKREIADYVLVYKGIKLAIVEAKSMLQEAGEGVMQAKKYADKLQLETSYSTNGKEIYQICMRTGEEGPVTAFLSPEQLWSKTFPKDRYTEPEETWRDQFASVPFEDKSGSWQLRYYQELAVQRTMEAIAQGRDRILLTLATGTGKTAIAFQIAWKLYQTRWTVRQAHRPLGEDRRPLGETNLHGEEEIRRRPRILFLADRNILADQAYNAFSSFPEDALVRIKPGDIRKKGKVPTNGSVFFTIFQTFMSGPSTGSGTAGSSKGTAGGSSGTAGSDTSTAQAGTGSQTEELLEQVDLPEIELIDPAYGYMYILQCADGSFYSGSTKNLEQRVAQHKNGEGAHFTAKNLPVKLVYYEGYDRIDNAFIREKQIQKWSRAKKIALIQGDMERLQELSKSKSSSYGPSASSGPGLYLGPGVHLASDDISMPEPSSEPAPLTVPEPVEGTFPHSVPEPVTVPEPVEGTFPHSVPEPVEGTFPHSVPEPVEGTSYFGEYPRDYFDLIIIDECHRGGANDESNWRGILEYFSPAVQLGLTATPKRKDNVDTYRYFGEPVYIYSLKEGINDGFLTPFKVKRIKTTLDDYRYTSDDTVVEGEIEEGKLYEEKDFNRTIEIVEREAKRVNVFLDEANQQEKAIIFCANQGHAALIRDLVNQYSRSRDPFYCVRVTANDGEEGERLLREFQDNEKTIPTILTTSQKLSTGVDARNIRSIVLMRPVNSMIEFKQIVGRGTRLFDGKEFFTIYDFVDAYKHFSDPEWDGEPVGETAPTTGDGTTGYGPRAPREPSEKQRRQKARVKLGRGKEREIQSMISTSFWSPDGKPISAEEFLSNLFGELPRLFQNEDELRQLWGNPLTRKVLLQNLEDAGFPKDDLLTLQKLVDMENSDLYDVLEYVFNGDYIAMTREARAKAAEATIFALLNDRQKEFIAFVLAKYIETGVEELDQEKLPTLLLNKYHSLEDAKEILGDVANISRLFIEFQKYLYQENAA